MKPMFEVDRKGLAKVLAQRGMEFAVLELVQNALDERVAEVKVSLAREPTRPGCWWLSVEDDSPEGFVDLSHSYTLFAESKKKGNPLARGRFNLGEKLVIAVALQAHIVSTKGSVIFEEGQRRETRVRRERGTEVKVLLRMSLEQVDACREAVRSIIIPEGVTLRLDGQALAARNRLASFEMTLPSVLADAEGNLRPTRRLGDVHVYPARPGVVGWLYELGIPVVETGDLYDIDIRQKVPLNMDRDNVTPGYLRQVRTAVLNHMHTALPREEAAATWVDNALESKDVSPEAVASIIHARHGDNVVVRDINNPEANKRAAAAGFAVIEPGSYNREQWSAIREAGVAPSAGKLFADELESRPAPVPREKWTPGIHSRVRYAQALAAELLGVPALEVNVVDGPSWRAGRKLVLATYAPGSLTLNRAVLGEGWFNGPPTEAVHALLIHEFGHHYSGDHLSEAYHEGLCRLGARFAALALRNPALVRLGEA